jgi:hypothetical protein
MTLSHPKFAGYQSPTDGNHLIYDLVVGGRPVQQMQPSSYQSPQQSPKPPGYQPSRPLPRDQIGDTSPHGYPIQPRGQQDSYTGRF